MLDIIVLSKIRCSQCLVYIVSCLKRDKYMSVSEIKDIAFIKHLRKKNLLTFDKNTNLKKIHCM